MPRRRGIKLNGSQSGRFSRIGKFGHGKRPIHEKKTVESHFKISLRDSQDDFNKYRKRIPSERIRRVFRAIPGFIGKKFFYSQVAPDEKPAAISHVLDLLYHARIAYSVKHTSSNGVPLAAEVSSKYFKVLFLDVGLMSSFLGLALPELMNTGDFTRVHQGSQGSRIIPVEVKAGKSGKLKSLFVFVSEKNKNLAIRFYSEMPNIEKRNFKLIHLPLYMVGETLRLLAGCQI